jgi:hypothetical protein
MVVDRCTETQPHPAHHNAYALAVVDCPGVRMPRPVPSLADRIGRPEPIRLGGGAQGAAEVTAERDQARAERDNARECEQLLTAELRQTRQHLADARQTVAAQAAQLRANGTLLVRLRDLDEQRDRAWAARDTVSASTNLRLPSHWTGRCAEGCTGHPEGDPTDATA